MPTRWKRYGKNAKKRGFNLLCSHTKCDYTKVIPKKIKIKNLLYETRDNFIEVEGDLGAEYYSLKSYSDIWNARGLLTGRMNLSLFETMPNILIGAGLMFTFMFLAWALADAGGAMGVGSAEAKNEMLSTINGIELANKTGNYQVAEQLRLSLVGSYALRMHNLGALDLAFEQLDDLAALPEEEFKKENQKAR